jgi:regulator of protease activity HflC (stomatin/prohibitin superfamily)
MDISGLVNILAVAAWILFAASIAYSVYTVNNKGKLRNTIGLVIGALVLAFTLSTISAGLVFVQPTDQAVVISAIADGGIRPNALGPGVHWVTPWLENVQLYSISKRTYTMSSTVNEGQVQSNDSISARTADGQEVKIDASLTYMIDPTQVVKVHIDWQNRFENDLVRPQARGAIRESVAQFKVAEVYSVKREELAVLIAEKLQTAFKRNGLVLDSFVMRDISFSPEYAQSIELKQIAEQDSQRAALVVQQKKQEAEQARAVAEGQRDASIIAAEGRAQAILVEAKAQAEALRTLGESLKVNPDLLQYVYVQKLSDDVNVMLVPSNSPYLLNVPGLSGSGSTNSVAPIIPTAVPTAQP